LTIGHSKTGISKQEQAGVEQPCFEIFSAYANCHAASPGVYLKAGQTYKLELVGDNGTNVAPRFLINDSQTLGGQLIDTMRIVGSDNFNIIRTKTFNVSADGTYYLIIHYPVIDNYNQLKLDNIRIIGDLENPVLAKLVYPAKSEKIVEKSTVKLRSSQVTQGAAIQKIEYYANGILLGESTSPPYDYFWNNVPSGNYSISARTYDVNNRSAYSTQNMLEVRVNDFKASTLFGSNQNDDIRGAAFQKDGTIVLAGNIGRKNDFKNLLLNSTTDSTNGCVIRLSTDGKSVLSITRLTEKINDIDIDSSDNIYVGGKNGTAGIGFKLNREATEIIWQKTFTKYVHRLDVSPSGKSVFLTSPTTNFNATLNTDASTLGYLADGQEFFSVGGASQYTSDVVIDDLTQTIVQVGYKNFNTHDSPTTTQTLPVYVPVIRAHNFAGVQKYVGYNWGQDRTQPDWLNLAENNMADVRTSRAAMGKDGKLYITYEVFGGNHILRYSPFSNTTKVTIVRGDSYFNFSNTGTESKVFVGRYDVGTGNYLLGQQLTNRLSTPPYRGNTIFSRNGAVAADEDGRIYLTAKAASGSPLSVDHQPGEYSGGAMMYVLSPNMASREMCVRLTVNGDARALAVQSKNRWIFAGDTNKPLYSTQPVQPIADSGFDAFWAVIDNAPCAKNYSLGRNNFPTENSFVVKEDIKSEALIQSSKVLIYDAKNSIELKPGFTAEQGSVFTAKLVGCQ
jgi:hypothetical protein